MILNKQFKILLVLIVVFCFYQICFAQSISSFKFDKRTGYDVYVYTGTNNVTVIKNVEILDLENIQGTMFLKIKSNGFKLKDAFGYIALNSVVSILPNMEYEIINVQKVN